MPVDLNKVYAGLSKPAGRVNLDAVYGGLSAPTPSEGYLDRIKHSTGKDWLATGIRLGGGFLAGIPSMVPGLGTLAGAGIGGGSELLAQLIQGEPVDWAGVGVGAAAGAIPMGKILSVAAPELKALTGLQRVALLGKATGANVAKGAALNVGLDVAYKGAHGEMPGVDYSLRQEVLPAVIGGAGMGIAGAMAGRLAKAAGAGEPLGTQINPAQGALDFEGGASAAERRAAYRLMRGYDSPSPSHAPVAPPPEPLTPGASIFKQVPGTKRWMPATTGDEAPVASHGQPLGMGRNINQPLREGLSIDEIMRGAIAPEPMVEGRAVPGRRPWEPRQPALGVERTPVTELSDLEDLVGLRDVRRGAPAWPRPETIARGRAALEGGQPVPRELMDFFGMEPPAREPIGAGFSDVGQLSLEPNQAGSMLPPEPPAPRQFGWQGPSGISTTIEPPAAARGGNWTGGAFSEPAAPAPTGPAIPRPPAPGPDWPANIPAAQRAMGEGTQPPENYGAIRRFFGMDDAALPPGLPPEPAPTPPGILPESSAPAVPEMTADRLRALMRQRLQGVPTPELDAIAGQRFADLPPETQQALRNILDDLESRPFVPGEAINTSDLVGDAGPGLRDDATVGGVAYHENPDFPNLLRHTKGAPVFHEIMQDRSGTRNQAIGAIRRFLEGGRPTTLTERATLVANRDALLHGTGDLVDVAGNRLAGTGKVSLNGPPETLGMAPELPEVGGVGRVDVLPTGEGQPRLPGEVGAVRDLEVPSPQFDRAPAAPEDFSLTGQGGAGQTGTLDFAAAQPPKEVDPRIRELYDWLQGELDKQEAKLAQEGNPLAGGPRESLDEFNARLRTANPRDLWNKERKLRAIIDQGGFITPELLMQLGGAATGAAVGPWVDEQHPLRGAAVGALAGFLAGRGGARLLESPGMVNAAAEDVRPVSSKYLKPGERPPVGTLKVTAGSREPDIRWMDPSEGRLKINASGESSASLEALSRQRGMSSRGEQYVVYDRTGARRPLIGPDAVDYHARAGETYGVEGPTGFRKLDDLGGRYPGKFSSDAGFINMAAAKGMAPLAGGAVGAVAGPAVFDEEDPYVATVGGGAMGALAGLAFSNPALLERLRYSSLLSGAAMPKSMLGDLGAMGAYALEHPGAAGRLRAALSDTAALKAAGKRGWEAGLVRENLSPTGSKALSYPGRVMGTFDEATRDALMRAGAMPEDAASYVLMGEPSSQAGRWLVRGVQSNPPVRAFLPFARTSVNAIERGLERLPGIGELPSIKAWQNPNGRLPFAGQDPLTVSNLATRRQVLGALAMLAGGGIGALSSPGGPLEDYADYTPYMSAALGPYMLPVAIGNLAVQGYNRGGGVGPAVANVGQGIERELPLPRTYTLGPSQFLRQLIPYGGALAALSPVAPQEFNTSDSLFAPSIARVPLLNELLLEQKNRRR